MRGANSHCRDCKLRRYTPPFEFRLAAHPRCNACGGMMDLFKSRKPVVSITDASAVKSRGKAVSHGRKKSKY